ncbi:hypothetical protein [Paenibacillus sp. RUD330]|uniref:hypothetical protein n=1 Tax=Paenibacillus sp. RUD330 TaxID=2023772 RepID=UPI000B92A2C2|nr:hypothetical protein [Paenibacillus sp. RUD330]ASS64712.1 hypothetical protein CIC07_00255 [Paenibacillus sp. RUD330]
MGNGTLRGMIGYVGIDQVCKSKKVKAQPSPGAYMEMQMYEAGMEKVLAEVATTNLRFVHQMDNPLYAEEVQEEEKLEAEFAKLSDSFPEAISSQLNDFYTSSKCYAYTLHDCGYVAGFLAGYRFLKEMNNE